jgi:glycerate 2-kinase
VVGQACHTPLTVDSAGASPLAELRRDVRAIVQAALAGVDPSALVTRALSGDAGRHLGSFPQYVACAAGKACAGMVDAFRAWAGSRLQEVVVSRGGHPAPDERSAAAAREAMRLAGRTDRRTSLVLLISGGASSMLAAPADGVTLADKGDVSRALLAGGVPIDEMNGVRKHLSAVKGGWLAARAAACCTLAISDVVGSSEDDPSVIGSGPGVADPTTFADAREAVRRRGLWDAIPARARDRLERGARGEVEETPKPGDPRLARASAFVVGGRRDAMAAARQAAEALGYTVIVLDEPVVGEARDAGGALVTRGAAMIAPAGRVCILSSGETTVTVRGSGRGGRNQELALAAVPALAGVGFPMVLASVGTDGVDGPTDAAGAIADPSTATRAAALSLPPVAAALFANDSGPYFEALGDLVRTGPTGTNVGDLQVLLGVRS